MCKVKKILLLVIVLFFTGCASGRHIVQLRCPKPPIMIRVDVQNGTIKGKELDHVIQNHESLWKHIHILEKLGCKP